ncbi:hypothetical protein [Bacillus andreraoultii]|uniref:hypothetical protein n=1 Tax=Bacillus andreraoultii TaxID=1499685 RepID=UPI00053B377D|nr:hypothetical protein [Bacillus andreraoultii]
MEKFEVKMPSDTEIDEQISIIVAKGLTKKQTIFHNVRTIWRVFPNRWLLFGKGEGIFSLILLLCVILFTVLLTKNQSFEMNQFYAYVFTLSPFIFISSAIFTFLDKKLNGTFEIEMTAKYTVYQMLAIRMFFYSLYASVINITFIMIVSQFIGIDVFRAIAITLSSLFLFATCLLILYKEKHLYFRMSIFCFTWAAGNIYLYQLLKETYTQVVEQIPLTVYFILVLLIIRFYFYVLKQFFTRNQGGAYECLS